MSTQRSELCQQTFAVSWSLNSLPPNLRGEFSLLLLNTFAIFCRIPVVRGVALLPTRPCFAGVFGVLFRIDDIDPSADRFRGDECTILVLKYAN